MYFLGIDIGSITSKCVIIDEEGKIRSSSIIPTMPNHRECATLLLSKTLSDSGISQSEISSVVATGYGRRNVDFRNLDITEITAHSRGASYLFPKTSTIIDIGGQDTKAIRVDEKGKIQDFIINDKCAAGTGRFLEEMAKTLNVERDKIGELALDSNSGLKINSTCTVFSTSEVISLISNNHSVPDIARAIYNTVADQIISLAKRIGISGGITLTGGVSKSRAIALFLEEKLDKKINIPENPQLVGAFGSALIGKDKHFMIVPPRATSKAKVI